MKEIEKSKMMSPEASRQLRQHLPVAPKRTPYTAHITRETPALILFILDQSGSMCERISFRGQRYSKAGAVAQTVDTLLEELINRCRKSEGIRDYFNIGLLGYGGQADNAYIAWDGALAGKKFSLPSEINKYPLRTQKTLVEKNIRGQAFKYEKEIRSWVNPVSANQTPMFAGLSLAKNLAQEWIGRQKEKDVFPPILFHITDGAATDADEKTLRKLAGELKALKTIDGALLLYNIHLSPLSPEPVLFPAQKTELPDHDSFAHLLFDMSSSLPELMCAEIKNAFAREGSMRFKALAYNSGEAEFVKLLNIGTSTSFTRLID